MSSLYPACGYPDTPAHRYGALSDMLSGVSLHPRSDASKDAFCPPKHLTAFCGLWTPRDLTLTMAQAGCLAHWKSQGFTDISLSLDASPFPNRHGFSVWTRLGDTQELLMNIVVWLEYLTIERLNHTYPAFCVEHLRLQNPASNLTNDALPGQDYPSSGMLRRVFGMIGTWAAATGAALITEIPEYFHTAVIFGRFFTFADAEMERIFRAMKRDLLPASPSHRDIANTSIAFEQARVTCNTTPYLWPTEMQTFALSHDLTRALRIPDDEISLAHFDFIPTKSLLLHNPPGLTTS